MKKLLLILVAFIMLLALVACDDKPCEAHVDANGDDLCDNCQAVFIDPNKPSVLGPLVADGIEKQLAEVKSATLDFEVKYINSGNKWYRDNKDEVTKQEYSYETLVYGEVVFSKTQNGVDLMVKATEKSKRINDEDYTIETDSEIPIILVINNVCYIYDENRNVYRKEKIIDEKEIDEAQKMFSVLTEGVTITDEHKNAIKAKLGESMVKVFDIKNNSGSVSVDLKDKANQALTYFKELDLDEKKIIDVLNDVLGAIDENLTVEKIYTELKRVGELTVNEGLAELDSYLTENHNTTLQGIYDKLMADENLTAIIRNIVKIFVTSLVDGTNEKELDNQVSTIMTAIKSFKIETYIEEAKIGDEKLFDIFEKNIEGAPTREEIYAIIDAYLNMTLAEFDEASETGLFSALKEKCGGIKINKLNGKIDTNFTGLFALESIDFSFNYDMETEFVSPVSMENLEKSKTVIEIKASLNKFSTEQKNITVSDDILAIFYAPGTYEDDAGRELKISSISEEEGVNYVYITLKYYTVNDTLISLRTRQELDVLAEERMIVPASEFSGNIGVVGTEDFVFEIDIKNESFTLISMPELRWEE